MKVPFFAFLIHSVAAMGLSALRSVGREKHIAGGVMVCIIWCWVMWAGKDISWDIINHHLYLPFSLISGRFRTDLYAAGPQSYQNPLGYLPFYGLVAVGAPSWLIGTILSIAHATAGWATYGIAAQIWSVDAVEKFWRISAVVAACIAPIFLIVVGSSSIDPISNILVMWALYAVLRLAPTKYSTRSPLAAGALLGLAFAIKPSNAIFLVGALLIIFIRCTCRQMSIRQAISFGVSFISLVALAMGAWSLWLWRNFGNPLFPLFNHYFLSPYAPTESMVDTRYIATSSWDFASRLFDMALYKSYVTTEGFVPDIRPLALVCTLACALVVLTWRDARWVLKRDTWVRTDIQLVAFSIATYFLWLTISGNARYAIPLFIVCGLLLVRAFHVILPRRPARVAIGLMLAIQLLYYGVDGQHRYSPQPWDSGPYIEVKVPHKLRDQPYLHLSLGILTYAVVAPYLHEGGALSNPVGQLSLPTEGRLGQHFQQQLQDWKGRTRFLFPHTTSVSSVEQASARRRIDSIVYRLGLQVDWSDCENIYIVRHRPSFPVHSVSSSFGHDNLVNLVSCGATASTNYDSTYEHERNIADKVFSILESKCPRLLGPTPFVSDRAFDSWQRNYMNSGARIIVSFSKGVYISRFRDINIYGLGRIDDVLGGRDTLSCRERPVSTPD